MASKALTSFLCMNHGLLLSIYFFTGLTEPLNIQWQRWREYPAVSFFKEKKMCNREDIALTVVHASIKSLTSLPGI